MNPIEEAVMPLKTEAIARAEKDAKELIARVKKHLAECGWNLDTAAPRPNTNMGRITYMMKMGTHNLYASITEPTWATRSLRDPDTRRPSAKREARFIKDAMELAAAQYDAFVRKLVDKIGACDGATLHGSHVWGHSFLVVTKGPTVERWKTQQIVNVSKLGKIFNQWPSRKLKR